MTNATQDILARAEMLKPKLVAWRRAIHQNPELGFNEYKTAQLVAHELHELGIEFRAGVGKTGIVAEIHSGKPGKLIGIRADMDALPIQEINDAEYASQTPNVMHACGHDAHTAMLLGAATLFAQHPPKQGGVRFLFQPCEETADDEDQSGAQRMVAEGAAKEIDAAIALHVTPLHPAGMVAFDSAISASVDDFVVTLRSPGGHASMPHVTVDTAMVLGHVLNGLYSLVPRRVNPLAEATLTVGLVRGGLAPNVIPDSIELQGTLRTRNDEARTAAMEAFAQVMQMAQVYGAVVEHRWLPGLPVALNDPELLNVMVQSSQALLGEQCVAGRNELGLGGEDFSHFGKHAPIAMLYLGSKMLSGEHGNWHTPTFDVDENALPYGSAILYESAMRLLG